MTEEVNALYSMGFIEGVIENHLKLTKQKDREEILRHVKRLEGYLLERSGTKTEEEITHEIELLVKVFEAKRKGKKLTEKNKIEILSKILFGEWVVQKNLTKFYGQELIMQDKTRYTASQQEETK